jgi:hypothetical protein
VFSHGSLLFAIENTSAIRSAENQEEDAAALEALCPLCKLCCGNMIAHITRHTDSAAIANWLGSAA